MRSCSSLARGEHEHGDIARGLVGSQLLQHLVARHAGQHQVEHDERPDARGASARSHPCRSRRWRRDTRPWPDGTTTSATMSGSSSTTRSRSPLTVATVMPAVRASGDGSLRRSSRWRRCCVRRAERSHPRSACSARRTAGAWAARFRDTASITSSSVRPRFCMSRRSAADQANVGVGIDEHLHVAERSQHARRRTAGCRRARAHRPDRLARFARFRV